jgi:hypothetical protein
MWAITYTTGRAAHFQASHIVDWMVHKIFLVFKKVVVFEVELRRFVLP